MIKPNGALRLPCKDLQEFFILWIKFLQPIHHLTDREISVLGALLKQRYLLCKVISDESILNKVLFSEDTEKKIREELNLSQQYYKVILSKLKKTGIIKDGELTSKFIPKLLADKGMYSLMLLFDINGL